MAGSSIEVPQTAPISAPLPTSVAFTINPRPSVADFHFQPSAPQSVQLLSTSTIHILQPDSLKTNNSSAPAKDSAGTLIQPNSVPLSQIQSKFTRPIPSVQNNSVSDGSESVLREKQIAVAKSTENPSKNRSLRTIFQQDCTSMNPADPLMAVSQAVVQV